MASDKAIALKCTICAKEYELGTLQCPDDSGRLVPVTDPLFGSLFADKYEIQSLLGEGGMSRVYKARHTFMKRTVAVKLLHESASTDLVASARFQLEAEAASALSHPNVVTVHDYGVTPDGRAYFIMDCLEGESLCDLLEKEGHLDLQHAVDVFTQVCEGLEHAHRKGIVHRDVKPSNLVIIKQDDGTELIKLVDFGIAKLVKKLSDEEMKQKKQITQTGEIFGTPAYMSPEQCQGRPLDARADIYSFGCLMYEALSGEPPLLGETFVSTAVKHVSELPIPLSEKAKVKVPPELEAVIMKCLEKDPNKRYPSAGELKQALYDAAYVAGLKGLRVGAVPVPKKSLSASGNSISQNLALGKTKKTHSNKYMMAALGSMAILLAGFSYLLFVFQGPEGDTGTLFDKFRWQWSIAYSDDLMRRGEFAKAAEILEKAEDIARTFGDEGRRLEATLVKQVEAYGRNHDASKLQDVNNDLVRLANDRVYQEFDLLMKKMKVWEEPVTGSVQREERAREAAAFGERLARCADKLSVRSRIKQELLLKRAIKVFDILNLREGIYRVRFRIQLAEIYRLQQRLVEQRDLLEQAVLHAPEDPETKEGWALKIQSNYLFGVLNSNTGQLSKAKQELEYAMEQSRKHLGEGEVYRDCLQATSELYKKDPHHLLDKKAAALAEEAKKLSEKLDDDEYKN